MNLREWLHARTPAPPDRLLTRVEEVLGERCERDANEGAELCLAAADELLRDLLSRKSAGRESALDLLTVDALVTYAFEAASASADELGIRATDAMQRFAAAARS